MTTIPTTSQTYRNLLKARTNLSYLKGLVEIQLSSVKFWMTRKDSDQNAAYEQERALERLADATERRAQAETDLNEAQQVVDEASRRLAERQARTYYGPVIENYTTGTTHFLNSWNETFCGTFVDESLGSYPSGDRRATCGRCQKAGDAAKRDGFANKVGSPASRW